MKITVEYLKRLNACKDQVDLFAKTFPDGAKVTRDNLAKARAAGLNVEWFAAEVYRGAVKSALINYHDSCSAARRAHSAASKVAGAAYDAAIAAAGAAYDAAIAAAWTAYDAVTASAWAAPATLDAVRKSAVEALNAARKSARDAYDAAIDDTILDVAEYRRTLKNYHDQRSLQKEQDK